VIENLKNRSVASPEREPCGAGCSLSHDLFNRLAVILGQCELIPLEVALDDTTAKRLRLIREAALLMSEQLQKYQYEIDTAARAKVAATGGSTG